MKNAAPKCIHPLEIDERKGYKIHWSKNVHFSKQALNVKTKENIKVNHNNWINVVYVVCIWFYYITARIIREAEFC